MMGYQLPLTVSVPLRGKYRGELGATMQAVDGKAALFPSPCGVNIVANLQVLCTGVHTSDTFPSPCGVNIVANLALLYVLQHYKNVSVPLRGKYRGEYFLATPDSFRFPLVSVPLRGKYRGECQKTLLALFCQSVVSVPLRGKYRGEFLDGGIVSMPDSVKVSVPLRGKYRGEYH